MCGTKWLFRVAPEASTPFAFRWKSFTTGMCGCVAILNLVGDKRVCVLSM